MLDIVAMFFTTYKNDGMYIKSLKTLAWRYLRSSFITDICSVLPGIVTYETKYQKLYYFKLLRFLHIHKIHKTFSIIKHRLLSNYFINSQETFKNYYRYFMLFINISLLFHLLSCIWIWVGR